MHTDAESDDEIAFYPIDPSDPPPVPEQVRRAAEILEEIISNSNLIVEQDGFRIGDVVRVKNHRGAAETTVRGVVQGFRKPFWYRPFASKRLLNDSTVHVRCAHRGQRPVHLWCRPREVKKEEPNGRASVSSVVTHHGGTLDACACEKNRGIGHRQPQHQDHCG